jgi:hypothetical protein
MKLILLVLLVTAVHNYRWLRTRQLTLPQTPDSINFLANNLLVTQTGRAITIFDTNTEKALQNFTADSDEPEIQVSPATDKVLFKFNKSIFQLQEAKQAESLEMETPEINWVFGLGATGDFLVTHQISSLGSHATITYLDIFNEPAFKTFEIPMGGSKAVVAGSNVEALSPAEYYFVSGGICDNEADLAAFYLYEGDSYGVDNVFNLSVPGCNIPNDPSHKEEWNLATLDLGAGNRWHAFTYVLDEVNAPRVFTTQVIQRQSGYTSEAIRFETKRLIGLDFVGQQLYSADDLLCRITLQDPLSYAEVEESTSVLPTDVISTVVSPSEAWILGLTASAQSYLLAPADNGSYVLVQTLVKPGLATTAGYFSNETYLVLRDSDSQLHIYSSETTEFYAASIGQVLDYCVTDDSLVFTITQALGESYILHVYTIGQSDEGWDLLQLGSRNLAFSA